MTHRFFDITIVHMKAGRRFLLVLALILALACQMPGLTITPTAALIPAATPTTTLALTETATPASSPTATGVPRPAISRVLILSIDGWRPDSIELAPMPNVSALMQDGAYTLSAQTIWPSSTLPSHASMLTGMCPAKHGVNWNDYIPAFGYARGTDLFDLAHAAGLKTVMYVGKEKLRQITEPESTDIFVFINDRDLVITKKLLENFPQDFGVLFIHFATTDDMGHEHGWLSPEQLSVLYRADQALGQLLAALDTYGLRGETLIILTADHGGHGTTHGSNRPEDMTIPWIASGPGIHPGKLRTPVHTMDTAATAAWALGLPIPPEWDGVPITEAFGLPLQTRLEPVCP
jgi:arylsulfatase A-like enzyme